MQSEWAPRACSAYSLSFKKTHWLTWEMNGIYVKVIDLNFDQIILCLLQIFLLIELAYSLYFTFKVISTKVKPDILF
jgi:hypothetical protein